MAKTINLTVNVDDKQVQKFIKDFGNISNQMLSLTTKFQNLTKSITQATQANQQLTTTMQSAWTHMQRMQGTAHKITRHIYRWGALISGVVALLGGGAFLGMDRIANRMMEQRRRLLGLGGAEYGKTQAFETFGKGLLNDPKGFLDALASAQTNVQGEARMALRNLGYNEDQIRERTKHPEKFATDVLGRVAKLAQKQPLELVKPVLESMKIPQGLRLTDEDLRRLADPATAQKTIETIRKRQEAAADLTPEDLETWNKFWESINNFNITMTTEWTKALAPLAPQLSRLTEHFAELTKALLESKAVTWGIQKIADGIKALADYMDKADAKQAFMDFINLILKLLNPLTVPKAVAGMVWDAAKGIWTSATGGDKTQAPAPAPAGDKTQAPAPATAPAPTTTPGDIPGRRPSVAPGSIPPRPAPATAPAPTSAPGSFGAGAAPISLPPFAGGPTATVGGQPIQTGGLGNFAIPGMPASNFGGGGGGGGGGGSPGSGSQLNLSMPSPMLPSGAAPSTPSTLPGSAPSAPSATGSAPSPLKFSSAVQGMSPSGGGGAVSSISNTVLAGLGGGGGGGGGSRGVLNANNWQGTRTASLVVRGVPSANLFVSANGMAS
jgi:hypothetical protein